MTYDELPTLDTLWLNAAGWRIFARTAVIPNSLRPPVVLVHGLGVSSRYLVPTARRLACEFSVYAPDLPGFGRSERPRRALNVPQLAETLLAWMDAARLERAALLGNSLGCQIIAEAAIQQPARVTQAVLVGPTIDAQARSAVRQLWRLVKDIPREPLSLVPIVAWDYLRCGLPRAWRTLQFALEDRIETKAPHLHCPTLVVNGEHDPLVPHAWAELVARLAPQGRLVIISGAGHASIYSSPETLVRLVREFLKSTTSRDHD